MTHNEKTVLSLPTTWSYAIIIYSGGIAMFSSVNHIMPKVLDGYLLQV
jgi:hypothetical protein